MMTMARPVALAALAGVVLVLLWAAGPALGQGTHVPPPGQAGSPTPRAARIRGDVQDILRSPDYRTRKRSAPWLTRAVRSVGRAVERFFEWLGDLLRGFSPRMPRVGSMSILPNIISAVFVAGFVIAVAWAVVAAVRLWRRRERTPRRKRATVAEAPDEAEDPAEVPVDTWLETARVHAAAGDFRRAYRAVFMAILLRLDHAGAIRYVRSGTNGEYLRALRSRPALLGPLRPVARDFDRRWYGQQPIGQAEYDAITAGYQAVVTNLEPAGVAD